MKENYAVPLLQIPVHIWLLICTVILLGTTIIAQEENKDSTSTRNPGLTIDAISYVDSSTSNIVKFYSPGLQRSFTLNYEIKPNLFAELQFHHYFYDSGPGGEIEIFVVPLMVKQYLSDKFYMLSGAELEFLRSYNTNIFQNTPQIRLINGFGYEVNSNFSIEAIQNTNLNSANFGVYSNPINMFSIKGKFRF